MVKMLPNMAAAQVAMQYGVEGLQRDHHHRLRLRRQRDGRGAGDDPRTAAPTS